MYNYIVSFIIFCFILFPQLRHSVMSHATDLSNDQIYQVFDMLDVDHSGLLDFDEFYLLICILVSIKVSRLVSNCGVSVV